MRTGSLALFLTLCCAIDPAFAATPQNTLVMARQIDDLISLDPAECYELNGVEILGNVYDRLVKLDPADPLTLKDGLATSWTVSADGRTYRFTLDPAFRFLDGAPVTAEDAVFSMRRVLELDRSPSFLLAQLGWTAKNFDELVHAVDERTVELTIGADLGPSLVLALLSSTATAVVEKRAALAHEQAGDLGNAWLKTHTAGSGPFSLVAWKPNQSVMLLANPNYPLGPAGLKRIVIRHVPEASVQRLLLQRGDIDIARDLTTDQLAAISGDEALAIDHFPDGVLWYISLNQAYAPLANPKVREAMRYLIDYQGLVASFLAGRYSVHQAFLPDGFPGAVNDTPYHLDVPLAKKLLAESGYKDGFDLKFEVYSNSPFTEIAQSIQATMGEAGIRITVQPEEQKQVLTVVRSRRHQMTASEWSPDYMDPQTNAGNFASNPDASDNPAERTSAWRNHWVIPELSRLTREAAAERDIAKRAELYQILQRRVMADGPFIMVFQAKQAIARRRVVKGFSLGFINDLTFYRGVTKQ